MRERRALLVGINVYDHVKDLAWCVDDALAMQRMLELHEDHSANFSCRTMRGDVSLSGLTDPRTLQRRVTLAQLREEIQQLFAFDGMALFYFSGHGYTDERGVYLVTQDATASLPGLLLNDVLAMANNSRASEIVLIIDSCSGGALGEPGHLAGTDRLRELENTYLRPGVTLLAAAMAGQAAFEVNGHGLFTHLVIGALKGGASDVRGQISAASIYAYVEQALGPWDQRPIYKSNASQLSSLRNFTPDIKDEELRLLPLYFPRPDDHFFLDPSYEASCEAQAIPAHVAIFRLFKRLQVARLLRPTADTDLYFAAINSHAVELTPLGQFYWQLASDKLLGGAPVRESTRVRTRPLRPDPESIARLFHESYERRAIDFGYETRVESRVPWEDVPSLNKHLMIATVSDVLDHLYPAEKGPSAGTEKR